MTITVKIQRNPLSVEFEVGSPSEAIGILEEHRTEWLELLAFSSALDEESAAAGEANQINAAVPAAPEPTRRGRKPKSVTASAPPPMPIPTAPEAAAPPVPDGGIPPFLKREAAPAAPVAPAAAPPPPPVPNGVMAGKIIAALDARATDDANKKALADWLASAGVVMSGATYDECVAVIRMTTDDKLGPVAAALSA